MATSLASPLSSESVERDRRWRERGLAAGLVTALTLLAVAIHGYHPYAEDGGVYLPEIKRLLRPELYPHGAEFVVGHLRFSLFAPIMAALARWSHLRVETVLLAVYLASVWATLFAAWLLAARCYQTRRERFGAVVLLAVWMTLPVAGTSLMLMDPYVTARSLSTPCALLALLGTLEFLLPRDRVDADELSAAGRPGAGWRGLVLCAGALTVGGMMHPLMAAYGLGCVMLLGCLLSDSRRMRWGGTAALCLTAVAMAGALQLSSSPESETYRSVMLTRYYWFLSKWQWYELMGLIAPLMILAAVGFGRLGLNRWSPKRRGLETRRDEDAVRAGLSRAMVMAGTTAMLVAVLFARAGMATHLVARLQPLRIFQLVYVVMILVVGAALAEWVLQRSAVRWVVVFSLLAVVMVIVERRTFPESARIELPWAAANAPGNQWEQAFAWISRNTPEDAVFALDTHYITSPGEDAQGFRAIAERSVLPDYSKDGGVVAIEPALTAEWTAGQTAQRWLNTETDRARIAALRPLGVSWVVLYREAATGFRCEYANEMVKVCRLP